MTADRLSGSRAQFAATVRSQPVDLARACLLIGAEVEPGLDPALSLAELDRLAADVAAARLDPVARPAVADDTALDEDGADVESMRRALRGFTGDAHDYGDLRSSLLHEVLHRRAGLPILLSVVWLEVARRADIDAHGVGLPGHFIVNVAGQHLDPFSGGAPLDVRDVPEPYLRPWQAEEILLRILTNIRVWAGRVPSRADVLLWATELSLLVPHHPVELRRERGTLRVASGDFVGGAVDLEHYAEAVAGADAPAAEQAQRAARAARARLN